MGENGFKHITVTPAEDEDMIIHAGVSNTANDARPQTEASAHETLSPSSAKSAEPSQNLPAATVEDAAPAAAVEGIAEAERIPKEAKAEDVQRRKQQAARQRGKQDDGYQPTTLDDLQGQPMPGIQKAVIIAAIICIIGAIVYYIAFML